MSSLQRPAWIQEAADVVPTDAWSWNEVWREWQAHGSIIGWEVDDWSVSVEVGPIKIEIERQEGNEAQQMRGLIAMLEAYEQAAGPVAEDVCSTPGGSHE